MDTDVIGRGGDDERATLEELAGPPVAVGRVGRGWLIALAAIAAIACLGFAGTLFPSGSAVPDAAAQAASSEAMASATTASPATPAPRPAIQQLQPRPGDSVIGSVSVEVLAASGSHVDISVTDGAALVRWRNVQVGADGHWIGTVAVVASQAPLPAVVRATGNVRESGVEAGR